MRGASVLIALVVLHAPPALACSCVGSTDPVENARELTDQAATVVLARINSVVESATYPLYSARITILERFKGDAALPAVTVGTNLCHDVDLKPHETKVIFVDSAGSVLGCSAYFISTEKMVGILRKQKSGRQ
jgi:hypothetical protein